MRPLCALLLLAGCAAPPPPPPPEAPRFELAALDAPAVVRAGASLPVSVRVLWRSDRAGVVTVRARLLRDGREDSAAEIDVAVPAPGEVPCELALATRGPGEARIVVEADGARPAERSVRVAGREWRVLFVEGSPRYEYRFLKNAMIRDRGLLVHCWLTSADEGFAQEHSQSAGESDFQQPLRAFPATLLELLRYDVVVLGDVDLGRLGSASAVAGLLDDFVRRGRGLVLIAGAGAASNWGLIADVVPVALDQEAEADAAEPLEVRLTDDGRRDRILRTDDGEEATVERWEDRDRKGDGLQAPRWVKAGHPRRGTTVLATAGPRPLFVRAAHGDGRVFYSGTDETWLWRYLVGDEPWYYPFWRRAIGWAAGE
jgi:hypothetical protein